MHLVTPSSYVTSFSAASARKGLAARPSARAAAQEDWNGQQVSSIDGIRTGIGG